MPDIRKCNEVKFNWLKRTIKNRFVEDNRPHAKNYNLTDEDIDIITRWIMGSESKRELNNHLQKKFYNEDVKYIFSRLKDLTYNL